MSNLSSTPKPNTRSPPTCPSSPIDGSNLDSGFQTAFSTPHSLGHPFGPQSPNSDETVVSIHPKHLTMPDSPPELQDIVRQLDSLSTSNKALHKLVADANAANADLRARLDSADKQRECLEKQLRDADQRAPDFEGMCKNIIKSLLPGAPTQASSRRGPPVKLPRFDGQNSFEKWRQDLELHFDYLGWAKDDPQRAAVIPTLLDDYAKFRYLKFPKESRQSYDQVLEQLDALFATSKKPLSVRRNYMNRRQKHGESVREFSAIILQRFSECNPPLETQIDVYCNMLLPEISAEIRDDDYDKMEDLIACAEQAEHRLRLRREAQGSLINQHVNDYTNNDVTGLSDNLNC